MKRNYLLSIIVIGLIVLSLYSTYAMFTASISTNDIVNLSASTIPTNTETIEYERLTIKSKEKKVIEFTVSNNTNSSLYYGIWCEVIKPTSINDDIVIGKKEDTQNDTLGQLSSNSNAKVSFVIENKTSSSIIINIGVGYSNTSSLNLPTNRYLITGIYKSGFNLTVDKFEELGVTINSGTPDFNQVATTDEGIWSAEDDLGTSYYFRGASENNYVKFAGFYWRIIRINGDGTIRMIYDGTSAHPNGEFSTDRQVSTTAFNSNYGNNAYVGYMYGTPGSSTYEGTHANTNNSTIKTANDNWYKTNIVDKNYSQYVADAIYCNDRSISSGTGIGTTATYYMAYDRLDTNKTPSLKCTQNNDKFTTSSSLGNGALTYPVGLITADEIAFAGGNYNSSNSLYYLYNGQYYWTICPARFGREGWAPENTSFFWYVKSDGKLDWRAFDYSISLRPVISLKSNTIFSGNGSMTEPFEIVS